MSGAAAEWVIQPIEGGRDLWGGLWVMPPEAFPVYLFSAW